MNNAIKYTSAYAAQDSGPDRGPVRYLTVDVIDRYDMKGEEAAVVFTNLGTRVHSDELNLISVPGYRGREAQKQRIVGSGIGLSETKKILESFGGRLKIRVKEPESMDAISNYFEAIFIFKTKGMRK